MHLRSALVLAGAVAAFALPAAAEQRPWTVQQSWVEAHEAFLASPALRGRGSATHDETVAATYVAAMFQAYGVKPAPGMDGYLQSAPVTRTTPGGRETLSVGGLTLTQGQDMAALVSSGGSTSGSITLGGGDPSAFPAAPVLLIAPPEGQGGGAWINAAIGKGAKLVVIRETEALKAAAARRYPPRPSYRLSDAPASGPQVDAVIIPAATYDRLAAMTGQTVTLDPGPVERVETVTTNAIGWIEGSDPNAGVVMISAHLDHLGVVNGVMMPGANDDASGTAAVLELAHALAAGDKPRRSVLFVAYGSEEAGLLGSRYFGEHPPVPLDRIIANLEIEMIGGQDPSLPPGVMMMTGFDRSNFGPALKERGALITGDPYPDQHFFERSDNYSLALKGIVAHTISGYAVTPTYHTANDTLASIDPVFMTRAIQSLVEPLRWLVDGDFAPQWTAEGRPQARGR